MDPQSIYHSFSGEDSMSILCVRAFSFCILHSRYMRYTICGSKIDDIIKISNEKKEFAKGMLKVEIFANKKVYRSLYPLLLTSFFYSFQRPKVENVGLLLI